jgi:hypothetical protein
MLILFRNKPSFWSPPSLLALPKTHLFFYLALLALIFQEGPPNFPIASFHPESIFLHFLILLGTLQTRLKREEENAI